ncbi:MAG: P1 family peptidase, partial [Candidatus Obscuribacterales bacterium]|nr:P1 family peptidase [Candidatus Obscuribacterales bacterium]
TIGVLVNSNFGARHQLKVNGVAVGAQIEDLPASEFRDGSICIVVATDAPMSSLQLERLSRRATMGLARTGATAQNGSGDFVVAFSTTRRAMRNSGKRVIRLPELDISCIDPLFEAVADATEEAVLNSIFMARTTIGRDGNIAHALPIGRCLKILNL